MDTMDESHRMEQALQQLALLIRRHAPDSDGHSFFVADAATHLSEPLESVYKPSICGVAQGIKMATLADETYRYDPSTYLVTSVELRSWAELSRLHPRFPI
ncbi:AraC-type transcriptional regulator N-terminus [Paenibacillus sp. 1_12]|nr:AraC-type transcriptional regulator N-terminus [Paenibacillus sp. 1_12]